MFKNNNAVSLMCASVIITCSASLINFSNIFLIDTRLSFKVGQSIKYSTNELNSSRNKVYPEILSQSAILNKLSIYIIILLPS